MKKSGGKNLVPSESFVHDTEQVQIYYKVMSENSNTLQTDLKILTKNNSVYEFYDIDIADMKDKSFLIEKEDTILKLKYTSLSDQSEKEVEEYIPSISLPETSSEEDYAENDSYEYDAVSSYESDDYDSNNYTSDEEDSNYQPEPYYGEVIEDKTYTNSDEYYQDTVSFGYE